MFISEYDTTQLILHTSLLLPKDTGKELWYLIYQD